MIVHLEPEERAELLYALMETKKALYAATRQAILSYEQQRYEQHVHLFQQSLRTIERKIELIRELAAQEKNRRIAAEMESLAHECELVFVGLSSTSLFDRLNHGSEHFEGRINDASTHAHLSPLNISFHTLPERRSIFDFSSVD
jgi:hypothetical protein